MPVRKYRSVEDMPEAALRARLDLRNTRIAFGSERSGKVSLRQKVWNDADESLIESPGSDQGAAISPSDWSPDGRVIAYTVIGAFPVRSFTNVLFQWAVTKDGN